MAIDFNGMNIKGAFKFDKNPKKFDGFSGAGFSNSDLLEFFDNSAKLCINDCSEIRDGNVPDSFDLKRVKSNMYDIFDSLKALNDPNVTRFVSGVFGEAHKCGFSESAVSFLENWDSEVHADYKQDFLKNLPDIYASEKVSKDRPFENFINDMYNYMYGFYSSKVTDGIDVFNSKEFNEDRVRLNDLDILPVIKDGDMGYIKSDIKSSDIPVASAGSPPPPPPDGPDRIKDLMGIDVTRDSMNDFEKVDGLSKDNVIDTKSVDNNKNKSDEERIGKMISDTEAMLKRFYAKADALDDNKNYNDFEFE